MNIFSNFFNNTIAIENLDSETFESKLKNDPSGVLIDTRTKAEFEDAKIPGSFLIDFMSPNFADEVAKLDKSKSYYLYCRSGNRSYHAAKEFKRQGFERVYNLEDGIINWNGEIE